MLRSSHILMLTAVALLGMAVVMVHSAGMTITSRASQPPVASAQPGPFGTLPRPNAAPADAARPSPHYDALAPLTSRNAQYAVIAIIAMLVASRINVRQFFTVRGAKNPLLYIIAFALLGMALPWIPGIGREVNGARRWAFIGPSSWGLSFQPSELVKWVMVLAIAWWCARRRGVMHRFWAGLFPALALIGVACVAIVVQDLGTAALVALVAGIMLIAGGARLWQMALTLPPAAVALVLAIMHSPYRRARLTAFVDPWADPQGNGYHAIQSLLAISQGGLTGRGLGNGIQKFGYLPEDTTDFIFAIICEENGIAGAAMVIGLYLILIWVGLGIIKECKDTFGRLLGLGVILTVGLQALINIAVVTVVVPSKGIALPLISGGGTGWIVTAFALGLVAGLDVGNRQGASDADAVMDLDNARLDGAAAPASA